MQKQITLKKSLLFLSFIISVLAFGQEKVKGNKIVKLKTQAVEEFTSLEVGDLFEVELVVKSTPTVSIDADSNLHKFIEAKVVDGKLEINATKKFSRYKRLFVEIGINNKLINVFAKGKAVITSNDKLLSDKVNIECFENSKVSLNVNSKDVTFFAKDKSELTVNVAAEVLSLNVVDSAEMTISAEASNCSVLQGDKSELVLDGKAGTSVFQVSGSSFLNSAGFISGTTTFNAKESADSYINVSDKLTLDVTGKSNTYVLGSSLIVIQALKETASIHKTDKAPSTLKSLLK